MAKQKEFWGRGQRHKLAKRTGIPFPHLSDILHRRRGVSKERAKFLEKECKKIKLDISFEAWLFSRTTKHAAFFGKPINS